MPALDKLTERQRKFIRVLASEPVSQAEAARRAGYSANGATVTGARLANNSNIVAKIEEYRAKADARALVTLESHINELTAVTAAALSDKAYGPAVAAIKAKGQVAGLYDKNAKPLEDLGLVTLEVLTSRLTSLLHQAPEIAALTSDIVIDQNHKGKPLYQTDNVKGKRSKQIK